MKYEVLIPFKIKTSQKTLNLERGQIIILDEAKAVELVFTGKLRPIDSIADTTKLGQPFSRTNPLGYPCSLCDAIAERYMLSLDKHIRWGWFCLRCRPYTEPERN